MHLLVIGGTVFLGRHIVLHALAAGHKVTTLNRGTHTVPEQIDVEKLIDDREKDLDILAGRKFDAVIDVCGYRPEVVAHSAEVLKNAIETYLFISTISVYGTFAKTGLNEADPIKYTKPGEPGDYGTLKADCEKVLQEILPDKSLIIRPGLIVGPYDSTDRFTYWAAKVLQGGKILAPASPTAPMQIIDVRDLSRWVVELVEKKARGVYNATGPREPLTMRGLLESCKESLKSPCKFVWLDEATLEAEKVQPSIDLPFWIPESATEYAGFAKLDCSKAFAAGLTIRPLSKTIRDTAYWDKERQPSKPKKAGMAADREAEIVARYS